jgi:uncharacterized surface protein with fasciclin (FAS1) repeats
VREDKIHFEEDPVSNLSLTSTLGVSLVALTLTATPFDVSHAHCGSCAATKEASVKSTAHSHADIVDTAVQAGTFNTLVTAVKAAGLVDALKSDGPLTVFAPTDDAFAKLPAGTVESLLKPENRERLVSILKYHVVAGKVPSETAVTLDHATTLNGQRADIQMLNGSLQVAGAKVVSANIETSNGIIHVVDRVMLPSDKSIAETAAAAGSFKTLLAAVEAAELTGLLSTEGDFTVFAPTDAAFAALPQGAVEDLLKPQNREQLLNILKYHVVSGRVYSDQALAAGKASTLEGSAVQIASHMGKAKVNNARLVETDIETTNGVIHVIDAVLMPADPMSQKSCEQPDLRAAMR